MIKNSINRSVLIVALAPLFIVIIIMTALLIDRSFRNIEDDIVNRGNNLATQAAAISEFYLFTGNDTKLLEIEEIFSSFKGVVDVEIIFGDATVTKDTQKEKSNDIQIFSKKVMSKPLQLDDFADFTDFDSNSTIAAKTQQLGEVHIHISRSHFNKKRSQIFMLLLKLSGLVLLPAIILVYFLSLDLRNSLKSLITASKNVESKNFNERCDENGRGELLLLQQTFNRMTQSLEINEQELQSKIKQATASLNKTIEKLSLSNQQLSNLRKETIQLERSKAISDERSRIMQDVHDGIGGQLVATLAILEKEKQTEIRNNIAEILASCLTDFRLIINSLNNETNTLDQLLADFKYRNNKYVESLNIKLHWNADESTEQVFLTPHQSLNLLRCLQELFSNIYKHARATEVTFTAYIEMKNDDNGTVYITLADNGICENLPTEHHGLGINNLKNRMLQINGAITLEINQPHGLVATMNFPIKL